MAKTQAAQKIEPSNEQIGVLTLDPASIIADVTKNRRFSGPDPESAAASFYASDDYASLAASFEAAGVQLPILVEDLGGGKYRVVEGYTRVRWAKEKRKEDKGFKIRATVVKFANDRDRVTTGVRLNVARNTFPPLAQARSYKELLALWEGNVKAVAKYVGVSVASIQARLSLLDLPTPVVSALESGAIAPSAVDAVLKLPGSREYFKTLRDTGVDDSVSNKADAYEKLVTRIVKDLTGRKGVDDAANADDVIDAYNSLTGAGTQSALPKAGKAEKNKKPETRAEVIVRPPRQREVLEFLSKLADSVVDEALSKNREDSIVLFGIDRIKDIGFTNGWAVPSDYESENYSKDAAETVTAEFVNGLLANAVIRKGDAQNFVLPDKDALHEETGWHAFTRRVISPLKLIDELQQRLVAKPVAPKEKSEEKSEEKPANKSKAKKKDR